jgi:hypothetical protein
MQDFSFSLYTRAGAMQDFSFPLYARAGLAVRERELAACEREVATAVLLL